MPDNTFFVSNSLTGRLTESSLADQSEEYTDYEYEGDYDAPIEAILTFETTSIVAPVSGFELDERVASLTLEVKNQLTALIELLANKSPILEMSIIDASNSSNLFSENVKPGGITEYKISFIKQNDSELYQVKMIFI